MRLFKQLTPQQERDFRAWARISYKPFEQIEGVWHPVVQDECRKINEEAEIPIPGVPCQ
jgi:hypothetical protein